MAFYHPRAIDPAGRLLPLLPRRRQRLRRHASAPGQQHALRLQLRDGGARVRQRREYLDAARHGLRYLRDVHRDPRSGGYAWTIRDGVAEDRTNHCYGVAFVLLAYSTALKAGIDEAAPWMDETWELLESRFWDADAGLYRDEADAALALLRLPRPERQHAHVRGDAGGVRGQRRQPRYLERALTLADHMTRRQAAKAGGLVWEHYDRDWNVDWDYHRDDPKHLFRPWGFQPGHQTEWAKLLLILDGHLRERGIVAPWLRRPRAHLFDAAVARAWDDEHGGLFYGFAPEAGYPVCDDDKYFWVQAESIAAAARLAQAHRRCALLGLVRPPVGLRVAAFRRSRARRLVPHPRSRQPQVQRREESGRQDRLPHHGRVLRRAAPAARPRAEKPMTNDRRCCRPAVVCSCRCWSPRSASRPSLRSAPKAATPIVLTPSAGARRPPSASRPSSCTPGSGYRAVRLGPRRAQATEQRAARLVRPVAADDAGRCARHDDPDGPGRRGARRARTDRHAAVVRQGHRRQAFRDRDPPARRPALGLPAHAATSACSSWPRTSARACCRRSIRRPACRTSTSTCAPARPMATTATRPRPARCCSSTARSASSPATRCSTRRPSARWSRPTSAARRSAWSASASTSRAASGRRRAATSARASTRTTSTCGSAGRCSATRTAWRCGRPASPRPTATTRKKSNGALWVGHVDMHTGKRTGSRYGALDAFYPGLLALSGDVERARRLQASSFAMWRVHGIEPEQYDYRKRRGDVRGLSAAPGDRRVGVVPAPPHRRPAVPRDGPGDLRGLRPLHAAPTPASPRSRAW